VQTAATWGEPGGLQLPGEVSIARHLISAWLDAARG
jgi:hypothetical protein